jgi:hypothetical protein
MKPDPSEPTVANIVQLKRNGILKLYHFTDASNVESIKKHGLMSASNLLKQEITSMMNSSEGSRQMDASAGLGNYVRLSFCTPNPMLFVALEEKRITKPVILEVSLQVVSRPGVLFSDCNATRKGCIVSTSPSVVRFDIVKKPYFEVDESLKHFYQAEVLVPSPLEPHLITIPSPPKFRKKKIPARPLPESVKMECPVRLDEKVSGVLSEQEPDRVEVARNGSVAKEPLVAAVSSTPAAPAIPCSRRSPCDGESVSQLVGCLSELVAPVTLPTTNTEPSVPVLYPWEPVPVIPAFVPTMFESSSVCSSFQIPKVVSSSSSLPMANISSSFCSSPMDEKMMTKKQVKKPDESKTMMKEMKEKNNNIDNAAELAAFGWEKTLGAACKQRTLKEPLVRSLAEMSSLPRSLLR